MPPTVVPPAAPPAVPLEVTAQLRAWRHALHEHPELGFQEEWTSDFLARTLSDLGLTVTRGIGGTGLVATLPLGDGPRSIGIRADMDALALHERRDHPYRSRNDGVMHACGHDGHMAMALGAALLLSQESQMTDSGPMEPDSATPRRGGLDGTVHFVFQPAEEHGRGAKAMIADGLFERFPMDAIHGLHTMPGFAAGSLHTRAGAIMASEDTFQIRITGRGGHAARPHMVVDPLVIGAQVVLALQGVVSRNLDPSMSAVLSCTEFVTDGVRNAIPNEVVISGDTRSYSAVVQTMLERRLHEISEGICAAHSATCTVRYSHEFEPTVNTEACVATAVEAALATVPADQVDGDTPPIMASEDFGAFLRQVPGCFTFIGNGTDPDAGGIPLHSAGFDVDDDILEVGARYYVELARRSLTPVTGR